MVKLNALEIAADNDRSLMALARAIELSQRQFSLVFVRCNYAMVRERMLQRLQEISPYKIQKLVLPHTVKTLFTTIQETLGDEQPSALIVLGLESVVALDDLLAATNQVRDEFRKRLPFPLVLWVNDEVLQKLLRLAPDFASWAATPIKFSIPTEKLLDCLFGKADWVFDTILKPGADKLPHNRTIEVLRGQHRLELESALKDLESRGVRLEPKLDACVKFIFGQDDYANDRIASAIARYKDSLTFWRNSNNLERQGILLFHLGLCYCRNADRYPGETRRHLEDAWTYLQQCIDVFEEAGRQDQAAHFITQLADVLQRLEAWPALEAVAKKSLPLHQTYGTQLQLAVDYGFLAKIALRQSRWEDANRDATLALSILTESTKFEHPHHGLYRLLVEQLYRLLLVKSQRHLGQIEAAANNLEKCVQELEPVIQASAYQFDPHRYLRILVQLRSLYFELGRYREAFLIKQEHHSVEQQYGLRAFIGAGQLQPERVAFNPATVVETRNFASLQGTVPGAIAASGRQQDVNRLLERISRPDYKLTVIHGLSGVGKSSIVTAGLVPALKSSSIGDQIALPIVVRVYRDWVGVLGRELAQELSNLNLPSFQPSDLQTLLEQLKKNERRHLLTILIFDQLEEFFLVYSKLQQRQEFYKFFETCLDLPSLTILLSIREDYLHYLLEFEQFANLEKFNLAILDKKNRYSLGNFSREDARTVIKSLTKRAHFILEKPLINKLVEDLAGELGEVRPIELQVVGAQLQAENITTLQQYQELGARPKQKLVERFLEKALKDCGPENERTALRILYSLTDENGNRPLKTKAELANDLAEEVGELDLILDILVESGLVFLIPEVPANRYQLIHDYLVDFIRHKEEALSQKEREDLRQKDEENQSEIERLREEKALIAEIADARYKIYEDDLKAFIPHQQKLSLLGEVAQLRKREELSQVVIEQLREEKELLAELAEAKTKHKRSEEREKLLVRRFLAGSFIAMFALISLTVLAVAQSRQAQISEINAISTSSKARFAYQEDIDALKEGLRAGGELKRAYWADTDTKTQVVNGLLAVVYGVREGNRLEAHSDWVSSVSFSPDGQIIASASKDETIKLWSRDGRLVQTLPGHSGGVYSLSFSPDSQTIASAGADNMVKLWRSDGNLRNGNLNVTEFKTLEGHSNRVVGVSFSPDGQFLASASWDTTVKLWSRDGKLLNTLKGHNGWVLGVSFSPDGQTLASASADGTIKLWRRDGTLLKTLKGHTLPVRSVSFSPDSKILASASDDDTIRLWSLDGNLLKTLKGHSNSVYSVRFSPDGKTLASGSEDHTVKLWSVDDRRLLATLKGHGNSVLSVIFSPDGQTIASASADNTVKLWPRQANMPKALEGHIGAVNSVNFSHDDKMIATASEDKTVKLWRRSDRKLLRTLTGHVEGVTSVSFSPDDKIIATASEDKTVKLWRISDGQLVRTLAGHVNGVTSVSFSPDGKMIATASEDTTVKLWRSDGQLVRTLEGHTAGVWGVSFSPDGQTIASASDDGTVRLWRLDGTLLKPPLTGHNGAVNGVSFSPDGKIIASGGNDGMVKLWQLDGQLIRTLKGHDDRVNWVSFSPDGQMIASASQDKTVKLWSRDGKLFTTLKGHNGFVFGTSFSPDGKMLASASQDKTVILWNLDLDDLLGRGCNWLHDYLKTNPNAESERHLCDGISTQR